MMLPSLLTLLFMYLGGVAGKIFFADLNLLPLSHLLKKSEDIRFLFVPFIFSSKFFTSKKLGNKKGFVWLLYLAEILGATVFGVFAITLYSSSVPYNISTIMIINFFWILGFLYLAIEDMIRLHINRQILLFLFGSALAINILTLFSDITFGMLFKVPEFRWWGFGSAYTLVLAIAFYIAGILWQKFVPKSVWQLQDWLLLISICLMLGYPYSLYSFLLAIIFASIAALVIRFTLKIKSEIIPVAPFMLIAYVVVLVIKLVLFF